MFSNSEQQVIQLCQSLVQQPSYSGEEAGVVELLKAFFQEEEFDDVQVDEYGNIYGVIIGKLPGKTILFDGHVDTVPIGDAEAWTYDPFGGDIIDNKIYGRGTTDMKGAIAAMACAAAKFAKETNRNFAGKIVVAGIVHEECFEGIGARKMSEAVQPDLVVIGEASNLDLKIGQRGRGEVVIESFGIPAHSANPKEGKNAVYAMSQIINAIRELEPTKHPVLGEGILELTDIKSSPYPGASVVPSYCRATYDRRLLVGETKESVLGPIEHVIECLAKEDELIDAKVSFAYGEESCYTGAVIAGERFFPGWLMEADAPNVVKIQSALKKLGFSPSITYYNFCTNGSHYAGEAGIETIGLGPSVESLAHKTDEYIEVEQLLGAMSSYIGLMNVMLKE